MRIEARGTVIQRVTGMNNGRVTVVQSYKEVADAINSAHAQNRPMIECMYHEFGHTAPTAIMLMIEHIVDFRPKIVTVHEKGDDAG